MKIQCKSCKKDFNLTTTLIKKGRRFCSRECFQKWYKNSEKKIETHKQIAEKLRGKSRSKEVKEKISKAQKGKPRKTIGKKNGVWKGDNASYSAIHKWIKYWYGKPTHCEKCGYKGEKHRIEWANKGHKYKRERKDWIMLCRKCHTIYDKLNH